MNYYDILGIERDASLENIQKAKDRLKFGGPDDKVPFNMWGKIDEAYKVLSDREKRREYDEQLEREKSGDRSYSSDIGNEQDFEEEKESEIIDLPEENFVEDEEKESEIIDLPEEDLIGEEEKGEIKNVNDYISNFKPIETSQIKIQQKLENIGKTTVKYAGGALAGVALVGSSAVFQGVALGFVAVGLLNTKPFKLIKNEINYRKISKYSNKEIKTIKEYYEKLDKDINKLLSEPHNNYKLKILELKYKNQTEFLEKLLEVKLNQKYRTIDIFMKKLDLAFTKIQLDTAKKNLKNINEKIKQYEKSQKRQGFTELIEEKIENINKSLDNREKDNNSSDISRVFTGIVRENLESIDSKLEDHRVKKNLSEMNKKIIDVNIQISENDKSKEKSSQIENLKFYQSGLLKNRNKKASNLKNKVIRTREVYDKFLRAKDFVVSLPYIIKSSEQVAEFVGTENQRLR